MRRLLIAVLFMLMLAWAAAPARAVRLKDIARVKGVRTNFLHGIGLVVGLKGTGDGGDLSNGVAKNVIQEAIASKLIQSAKFKSKNVAIVAITAEYPAFGQPGDRVDVTVSAMGSAKSLKGGRLIDTILYGPAGNPQAYGIARGSIVIGDEKKNFTTAGEIPNGAILETAVPTEFLDPAGRKLTIILAKPDFTTANNVAEAINAEREIFSLGEREKIAFALSAAEIQIEIPESLIEEKVRFASNVLRMDVEVDTRGVVVINERKGLIVIGEDVTILPVAVVLEGIRIEIASPDPQQPPKVGNAAFLDTQPGKDKGTPLKQLVDALNELQIRPEQLIAIIQSLKAAGVLQGEVIVI